MTRGRSSSLVVIGGWLGCKSKYLKRYKTLYNRLGLDVVTVIPTPLCIVDSTLHLQSSTKNEVRIPPSRQWSVTSHRPPESISLGRGANMQDLAWQILIYIDSSGAEDFIFHSFSNGGCFLWEALCRVLLYKNNPSCDPKIALLLERLYRKCKGIIFDSCPCWFGPKDESFSVLWNALEHCSKEEQEQILSVYGDRIKKTDAAVVNRNEEYFEFLETVPLDVPQLYLYSKSDELCSYKDVEYLIEKRRSRQQRQILKQVWDDSIHCDHLRVHNDDYTNAVKNFIKQTHVFNARAARL